MKKKPPEYTRCDSFRESSKPDKTEHFSFRKVAGVTVQLFFVFFFKGKGTGRSELRRVLTLLGGPEGDGRIRGEAMGLLSGVASRVFGYSLKYV